MVIRDKDNFVPIMAKMLTGLGYENVEILNGKSADIKAEKDNLKYCFKCRFDIDAISEKSISELFESVKGEKYDKIVFMTNSSFSPKAKKCGEAYGVELWDRNTIDRLYINVEESFIEQPEEPKRNIAPFIIIPIELVVAAALLLYWFMFK